MTGIRKSDNASHPAGRSRMWSNVHDLFHVRNMFYSQSDPVFYDSCGTNQPNEVANTRENIKKQKGFSIKNKRLAGRRGASHGRFPKEKRLVYTKFMQPILAPS
jgi:hypothetical protein